MSQSQSGFICASTLIAYALLIIICRDVVRLKFQKRTIAAILASLTLIVLAFYYASSNLRYLSSLFALGLSRNSYQARIQKSTDILNSFHDNPLVLLLGHGKDYFGSIAGAMDNEYLFIYACHGLIVLLIVLGVYVFYTVNLAIRGYSSDANLRWSYSCHLLSIAGIILAYPSSFILYPPAMAVIGIAIGFCSTTTNIGFKPRPLILER